MLKPHPTLTPCSNWIRTVFECIVWLFVVHPYDVGDTLVLGPSGENHRVGPPASWAARSAMCPNARRVLPPNSSTHLSAMPRPQHPPGRAKNH